MKRRMPVLPLAVMFGRIVWCSFRAKLAGTLEKFSLQVNLKPKWCTRLDPLRLRRTRIVKRLFQDILQAGKSTSVVRTALDSLDRGGKSALYLRKSVNVARGDSPGV